MRGQIVRTVGLLSVVVLAGLGFLAPQSAAQTAADSGAWIKKSITDTPDPVLAGHELTYEASATNLGPDPATNVSMFVGLPDDSDFVSSSFSPGSGQGECKPFDQQDIGTTCRVDPLGVGESATFTLLVRPRHRGHQYLIFEAYAQNGPGLSFEISEMTEVLNRKGCTIYGSGDSDRSDEAVEGTAGQDVICSLGGDDGVYGRGGNDVIYGGEGDDTIYGGGGNDEIRGAQGNDFALVGGSGKDEIYGGYGGDFLDARDGVEGNDVARGGPGRDMVFANRGDQAKD